MMALRSVRRKFSFFLLSMLPCTKRYLGLRQSIGPTYANANISGGLPTCTPKQKVDLASTYDFLVPNPGCYGTIALKTICW